MSRDATPLDVIEGRARWCVVCADNRDVLSTLPNKSVAHVITDPPYIIGAKSDGSGKLSPWADWVNASHFFTSWLVECRRVASSSVWSFTSWRTLVTIQKAACDLRWAIESLLVWNKDWIGPGGPNGLRPSYEMVALWCLDGFSIKDRSISDVVTIPWASQKPNGHPAEKPEALLESLVQWSGPGLVLDPFCGSGTTGVACLRLGNPFIGVELDEQWAEVARERLEAESRGLTLRDARAGQLSLLGDNP